MNPRQLRPSELVRILNSTELGAVTDDRRVRRHRDRAGLKISAQDDPNRVDLLRYTAWLVGERRRVHESRAAQDDTAAGYESHKDRVARRARELSRSGRNIGELPEVVKPRRKKRAATDFKYFCEKYFPATFSLAWSDDHLMVIRKIELVVLSGGLFAIAMPRGSGKSSLCEIACLWAGIYGHREFIVPIGATEGHATDILDSIKTELESNDLLLEDFPEVCYPIRALEGIYQRAGGQLYKGEPTYIGWSNDELVLPTIPGSDASGVIFRVAGLTGQLRGMKFKRRDGQTVRPSLVLVDDPQTDESARSPSQCQTRERILSGAVLGLAGPGVKIAGLMTVTVVRPDDMADRILDRSKHPQWQGVRTKMLYEHPENQELWDEYAEILRAGLAAGDGIGPATRFYRKHRRAMDKGARVAWKQRFEPGEISAIQNAMNILILDPPTFAAEYQNDPLPEVEERTDLVSAEEIAAKINNRQRGQIPLEAEHLVLMIDVQGSLLPYVVLAVAPDMTGWIVDYGTEPDQKAPYWTVRNVKRSMGQIYGLSGKGLEAILYEGLDRLVNRLCGQTWRREDGASMRIDQGLIDANWGKSTDTVYLFCRQSRHQGLILPSHGQFVGASSRPFREYKKKPGERVGYNWRIPSIKGKRSVRHVLYDTNYWKTFALDRFRVEMGSPGNWSLFGKQARTHRLFAEHLTAEQPVRTEARGRVVDEWKINKPGLDNHYLDCVVGAAVAASMAGASLRGIEGATGGRRRRRVSMATRTVRST